MRRGGHRGDPYRHRVLVGAPVDAAAQSAGDVQPLNFYSAEPACAHAGHALAGVRADEHRGGDHARPVRRQDAPHVLHNILRQMEGDDVKAGR